MAIVVASELISMDGYFSGAAQDLSWHHVDSEFNDYAAELLDGAGILLFGRVTYDLMARFWPTDEARRADPVTARKMNEHLKAVFSRSMTKADWPVTEVLSGGVAAQVAKLKAKSDGYVLVLGSGQLLTEMAALGLVDEYRLLVNPIVLGEGRPLFGKLAERLEMKLTHTRTFASGMVALYYHPVGKNSRDDEAIERVSI